MFRGVFTALITPFHNNTEIDEQAFLKLVEWQIKEGIHGLVPVGTTGESPTLSHDEHKKIIELCAKQANKRVPVIAGAGSNSTQEAIELAQHAQEANADAVLVVTPYYNNPNQRGLYEHFAKIAQSITIPIFIYNIPGRSIVDMSAETMARLAKDYSNIIGVKDATGRIERVALQREYCSDKFIQLSGDDNTSLGFNAHGGHGCISVLSNVAPRLCAQMQNSCFSGNYQEALKINERLAPLSRLLFREPSPAGIKYALKLIDKASDTVRTPIVHLEDETKQLIYKALKYADILR